jgi:preprotein translocase subunit SecG
MAILGMFFTLFLSLGGLSERSALRPAVLHNLAWTVGLAIVASDLLGYIPITGRAWFLILTSITVFNISVWMSGQHSPHFEESAYSNARQVPMRYLVLLLLVFTVGVYGFLQTISSLFGLDVLINDPESIRASGEVNYLEEFPLWAKLAFYMGPLCMVLLFFPQFVRGLAGRWWRLPLLIVVAAAQVITLQRTNLFVALLWIVGVFVLGLAPERKPRKPRRMPKTRRDEPQIELPQTARKGRVQRMVSLGLTALVAVAAFQGIASALGKTGTDNRALQSTVDARLQGSSWAAPMHYAASGIPAFSNLINSQNYKHPPAGVAIVYGDYNPQTWGTATFSGVTRLTPGISSWNEVAPFTRIPASTNVYTWLEPWYRDFRDFGVIMGALLMGLLIGSVANRASRGVHWQVMGGLLIGLTFLATFVNRFGMVMTLANILAVLGLAWVSRAKPARPQPRAVRQRVSPRSGR